MKHQKGITVLDISYNLIQDIPRVRPGIPYSFERHIGSGLAILLKRIRIRPNTYRTPLRKRLLNTAPALEQYYKEQVSLKFSVKLYLRFH